MAWCKAKGKECPVPGQISKLSSGGLLAEETSDRGLDNQRDKKIVETVVRLVGLMGDKSDCEDGPEIDDTVEGIIIRSCTHPLALDVDFVTDSAFGWILTCDSYRLDQ